MTARAPKRRGVTVGGIELTHPDRELWPGITKQELAEYWLAVAEHALPGLARRPLAVVRCPEGIAGEHFFQKHGHGAMPAAIRDGEAAGQPYPCDRRCGWADRHGADVGHRAARLGRQRGGTPASRPDRVRPRSWRGRGVHRCGEGRARRSRPSAWRWARIVLPHHGRQGAACRGSVAAGCRLGCSEAVLPRVRRDDEPGEAGPVSCRP